MVSIAYGEPEGYKYAELEMKVVYLCSSSAQ